MRRNWWDSGPAECPEPVVGLARTGDGTALRTNGAAASLLEAAGEAAHFELMELLQQGPGGSRVWSDGRRWYRLVSVGEGAGPVALLCDVTGETVRLQEREALLKALNDLVLILDGEFLVLNLIAGDDTWLPAPPEEIRGRHPADFFSGTTAQRIRRVLEKARDTGAQQLIRYPLKVEGETRIQQALVRPVGEGTSRRYVAGIRDVTRQQEMEDELELVRSQYRLIADSSNDWVIWRDPRGRFRYVSPACETLTGYSPEDFYGDPDLLERLILREDGEQSCDIMNLNGEHRSELRIRHRDGRILWVEHYCRPLTDPLGNSLGRRANFRDITERKEMELALRKSEAHKRHLFENATDMIWVYNPERRALDSVNPAVRTIRGLSVAEALQEPVEKSMPEEDFRRIREQVMRQFARLRKNPERERTVRTEHRMVRKDGSLVWVETAARFRIHPEGGLEIIGVTRDIHERKEAEEHIRFLNRHDPLTGLYNRRYFEECMNRPVTGKDLPQSLILLDVNGLKLVNDAFGHLAGDQVLRKVAQVLGRFCGGNCMCARISGDEFVMLLSGTGRKQAEQLVRRIRREISREEVEQVPLSAALGRETRTGAGEDVWSLFRNAETAMYRQKLFESARVQSRAIRRIMEILCRKSPAETTHSGMVADLCAALATGLGMGSEDIRQMRVLGEVHDIGKIAISMEVLEIAGPLDSREWEEVRRHPEVGYRILSTANEYATLAPAVLHHHERWDGTGYPAGLSGEEIPLGSRIVAVADAFESMVSGRPYRPVMGKEEALEEIRRQAGIQFDPQVVDVFEDVLD